MKHNLTIKNQAGFTLVQAIFILVVLALLGVMMMRLSGVQSSTGVFALQGARAYQAARSGLEWGAAQAVAGGTCNGSFTLNDFSVTVSCSSSPFTEGATSITVFQINAAAIYGTYGSPDFVSRQVQMKMAL